MVVVLWGNFSICLLKNNLAQLTLNSQAITSTPNAFSPFTLLQSLSVSCGLAILAHYTWACLLMAHLDGTRVSLMHPTVSSQLEDNAGPPPGLES